MSARIALSKKTRFEIFKRDKFTCQYCGDHPPRAILHVDHIHPVASGGTNDTINLITSCQPCNSGKGARLLSSAPSSLLDTAAELTEREEQLKAYQKLLRSRAKRLEKETWQVAECFHPGSSTNGLRRDWLTSIKTFIDKLGFDEVQSAMEMATSRKPFGGKGCFLYFCGICWNKVRDQDNG